MMSTLPLRRCGVMATFLLGMALVAGPMVSVSSAVDAVEEHGPESADSTVNELTKLSLEALMDITVTSVSRKPQRLADTASAVFVISQEDIRRSGATSIPEVLRMAPGVQVARIDSSKWAVSIRGMNGRFSNKLLVLQDGHSIYTPLFSGVYWETLDTPLEDIERIEVIRGPNAALWGSNAVNGVINIITRSAADSHGTLASVGGGTHEKEFVTLRHGTRVGETGDVSFHVKQFGRGPGRDSGGGDANDSWDMVSGGFRADTLPSAKDSLSLQGDFYSGHYNETYTLYSMPTLADPSYSSVRQATSDGSGGTLRGRWQRTLSYTDAISLQLSYDHYQRHMVVLDETRDTVDVDFQHRFAWGSRNDLVWGVEYRYSQDNLGFTPYISFSEAQEGNNRLSLFVHDEIGLIPGKLALILGSRMEYNDETGYNVQPNGRLIWTPLPQHTLWGSVSRAVRTPARGDSDITYRYRTLPPGTMGNPLPLQLEINGTSAFAPESILAYELGYRTEPLHRLTVDVSLFYNDYQGLRALQYGTLYQPTPATLSQPMLLSNDIHGHSYGYETSLTWTPQEWWRLQATYSYLISIMQLDNGSSDEVNRSNAADGSPHHQFSLRSGFDLGHGVELDLWLRGADRVGSIDSVTIPGYVTADVRLAWKATAAVELSLVGQNLLQSQHQEYIPEFINTTPSEVPRTVYGKVTVKF